MMTSRVLIFGDDMRIFLSLARAFGRTNKLVHVVPGKLSEPALKSKYVYKIHPVTEYHVSSDQWRADVKEILEKYQFDLIVPCVEPDLIAMNECRDLFKEQKLAIPSAECWNIFFDKKLTHEVCSELDIHVCDISQLSNVDTVSSVKEKFGLPLVIKPQRSYWRDQLDVKEKVYIIENINELKSCLAEVDTDGRFIIESYFTGVGVGVSVLANKGKILQAFQHRRLREGRGGSSSYRISEKLDSQLLAACEKLMQKTDYTGVCMFEFRVNRDTGNWVLLETNARFWGSMPLPISLGVDFPNQLLAIYSNKETCPQIDYAVGVKSRNYILDWYNLIKTEINFKSILPWMGQVADYVAHIPRLVLGIEKNDSFVADDMAPGIWELVQLPIGIVKKFITFTKGTNQRQPAVHPKIH